jgi:hypothetical protein
MERRPPSQSYSVQVLTPSYQFTGTLEIIGSLIEYLNDASRDGLVLMDAHIAPLTPGGTLKDLARPSVTVRRGEIVLIGFPDLQPEVRTLQRREYYIAYTPVGVVKSAFHLLAETRATDFLSTMTGELLPISEVDVFLFTPSRLPFQERADLMIIGKRYIQLYHSA